MDNKSFVLLMVVVYGVYQAILHPIDSTKQLIAMYNKRKAKKQQQKSS
jgi:hypothetical protein